MRKWLHIYDEMALYFYQRHDLHIKRFNPSEIRYLTFRKYCYGQGVKTFIVLIFDWQLKMFGNITYLKISDRTKPYLCQLLYVAFNLILIS